MSKKTNLVQFKANDELIQAINDVVARSDTKNRSEVVRALLWQVLADDAARGAVQQTIYDVSQKRKILLGRLTELIDDTIRERFPDILAETFGAEE